MSTTVAPALDELAKVATLLTSEEELREFRDPFAYATWDEYTASAVVMPETVEQVQEIVRIANRHGVPLWTNGQGRNNGYGGPAPRVKGSVIVSLRNMNRVLEIDEECGYAVVEPGVRWFDLYDAIQAGGHRLMLSIADVGWGSVVGNTLDHGVTYMPYGVDMGMQCGMEVVLPNGELMRTGMGAMEGNRAWHVYKRGLGPTPDQLFMQSNFGIVTKMGVWLMPYPEVYMPLWLRLRRDDDLARPSTRCASLMLDDTIRMVPQLLSAPLLASVLSERTQWWERGGRSRTPRSTGWRRSSTSAAGRCASRSTATRPWSTTASPRSRRRSSAIPRRTSTGPSARPRTSRSSSTRSSGCRAACRAWT